MSRVWNEYGYTLNGPDHLTKADQKQIFLTFMFFVRFGWNLVCGQQAEAVAAEGAKYLIIINRTLWVFPTARAAFTCTAKKQRCRRSIRRDCFLSLALVSLFLLFYCHLLLFFTLTRKFMRRDKRIMILFSRILSVASLPSARSHVRPVTSSFSWHVVSIKRLRGA